MACTISKEEIARVKGFGFLNNKGTDYFNGRVITRNGKITSVYPYGSCQEIAGS